MTDRSHYASLTNPLLATKVHVPQARPHHTSRARLTERLNDGLHHKLTLISAPLGFGKTSLLSEWASLRQQPVAWLSLDAGDNDPPRFWAYVIASVQTLYTGLGTRALALLQSPQPLGIESILTVLVNEIDAVPDSIALVLEDYHVVDSPAIHQQVTFLLEHLPAHMHLFITTRADPPLPLPQLRARDELIELRASDLCFSLEETAAFLNDRMGLNLSMDQLAELERKTEGWIAGLQLAALSLHEQEDRSAFIAEFTGSHRFVLDYLTDQVLERTSQSIQDFMLQTSILEQMTASLCDAVTGRTDSQTVLQELERRNLFLIPLDDERYWYRYHALFIDVLRRRLQETHGHLIAELHRRASEWLEQEGWVAEAVSHSVAAGDWDRTVRLIVENAEVLRGRGEIATLTRWMQALPDSVLRGYPAACLAFARVLVDTGQYSDAEELVAAAARSAAATSTEGADSARVLEAKSLTLRACLAATRGDSAQAIKLSQQAWGILPEEETAWRSLVTLNRAAAYRSGSNWEAAGQAYLDASSLSQSAGDYMGALNALSQRGDALEAQGRLRQAVRQYDQVLDFAQEWRLPHMPVLGYALVGLGRVWCEWNDLDASLLFTQAGMERGRQANLLDVLLRGNLVLARIRLAQGDATGALDVLGQAATVAQKMGVTGIQDWIDASQAQAWLALGETQAAYEWASRFASNVNDAVYPGVPYGLAQVWLNRGEPEQALPLLDHALESVRGVGRLGDRVHLLALKALALYARGDATDALAVLADALQVAEPEGYVRAFVEAGPSMANLLQRLSVRGKTSTYVEQLLAALGGEPRREPDPSAGLAEPLTRRELEVLRLIATGATNTEIARELVLTVNTVKKHTGHIFAKLGVTSRTLAVARARELKLL